MFAIDEIGHRSVRKVTLVDPDAEFLLEHDILADGTQSDAFALRFQVEGVAGSELQTVAEGLGENDATGFVEGELGESRVCHPPSLPHPPMDHSFTVVNKERGVLTSREYHRYRAAPAGLD